ncbi:hypothetical protein WJX72_004875 [[Myrmecia] bisecta]|uniref:Vps72/YL1 C-terminal domain-containing protein n=1 Tax=[Myrmecia] bisecta TaxID=41462 RepID=A0AAW1Q965_9CHLO
MADRAAEEDLFLSANLPFKCKHKRRKDQHHWRRLKIIIPQENYQTLPPSEPTYVNIAAPPSTLPSKKYCDLTGQEAQYNEPKTKIHYASADQFAVIRALPEETVRRCLELRNAAPVLR